MDFVDSIKEMLADGTSRCPEMQVSFVGRGGVRLGNFSLLCGNTVLNIAQKLKVKIIITQGARNTLQLLAMPDLSTMPDVSQEKVPAANMGEQLWDRKTSVIKSGATTTYMVQTPTEILSDQLMKLQSVENVVMLIRFSHVSVVAATPSSDPASLWECLTQKTTSRKRRGFKTMSPQIAKAAKKLRLKRSRTSSTRSPTWRSQTSKFFFGMLRC